MKTNLFQKFIWALHKFINDAWNIPIGLTMIIIIYSIVKYWELTK